jgi:hypothetical protein
MSAIPKPNCLAAAAAAAVGIMALQTLHLQSRHDAIDFCSGNIIPSTSESKRQTFMPSQ